MATRESGGSVQSESGFCLDCDGPIARRLSDGPNATWFHLSPIPGLSEPHPAIHVPAPIGGHWCDTRQREHYLPCRCACSPCQRLGR